LSKNSFFTVQLDESGNLILPSDLLAQYGIIPGAQIKLEESSTGFSLSRSSDNLARVYIEPTNICNLDCATCMRNVWDEPLGKMSSDTFERIMFGIKQLNAKPSIFFGGFGEPLTHPHILEMIASAKQAGSSVELITNGILLSPQICSDFIELGLDRLWVSLDGATPESYADVRLGDMLPRVLSNLAELQKLLRKKKSANPRLGIAFVAMKRNIKDLPKVIDLGKKMGADMFSISNVLPHTPEMLDDALFVGPHNGEVLVTEWSPMLSISRMEINELTKEPLIEAIKKAGTIAIARKDLSLGSNVCPFVEKGSISIRWDGAVSPCLALLHDNDNYLDFRKRKTLAYSIGSINHKSLIDIWNNPSYIALRKRLQSFDFAFCTSCNGCDMANSNLEDCYGTPSPTCGACLWAQGLIQCP
jgi:MoaA/NifB/PqqE/SkfB family radical SAM enzyme